MRVQFLYAMTVALALGGCATHAPAPAPGRGATATAPAAGAGVPLRFIVYGDTRFTDPREIQASSPQARRALVERIAAEAPAALFVDGDLPWHGVDADYGVFAEETASWRAAGIPVHPALGNHEFAGCEPATCLERWWSAFPELRGRRWYALPVGPRVQALVLDSTSSFLPGEPQRAWLDAQTASLPPSVRFLLVVLHHPPVADLQTGPQASHNPRPNERALADYLDALAARTSLRVVVVAGHIHNYERFARGAVTYLVSGGGGAHPYPVVRGADDLFQSDEFPNYHYLRFEVADRTLSVQMVRLVPGDGEPQWRTEDQFTIP